MNTLLLKLILTPALVGAASLAGRRWGPAVSGSLVGLPLTSGPIVLFIALDHGVAFASATIPGILAGTASGALYCVVYAWVALRAPWPVAILTATLAFAAATAALREVILPLPALIIGLTLTLILALTLLPRPPLKRRDTTTPRWDLPARIVIATAFVVALTSLAPVLGPQVSGLLAPFPLFTTILAAFAHHFQGAPSAILVLRGVLLGLFGFTAFFLVVALLLQPAGLLIAFACAIAAAIALQTVSLRLVSRQPA